MRLLRPYTTLLVLLAFATATQAGYAGGLTDLDAFEEAATPFAAGVEQDDPNLLPNGGFEGSLTGWEGYHATLQLVDAAPVAGTAARVTPDPGATSYSIYPAAVPVASTTAGVEYRADALVRGETGGRAVCVRIREFSPFGSLVGSARACLAPSATWQPFPTLAYTTRQNGGRLDVYVFEWASEPEDHFDVDDIALRLAAPGPEIPEPEITARAVDNAHIALSWPSVPGAVAYRVLRDGLEVARTPVTGFTDALLWPQTAYNYRIEPLSVDGSAMPALAVTATTAPLPESGFPSPFPSTSIWNRLVPADAALHPANASLLANWLAGYVTRPNMTLGAWGVAVAEAHPADKLYAVPCTVYSCTLDAFGPFRIPLTAKPDPAGDGHLVVHDPVARREWGMWEARYDPTLDAWTSSAGAAVSLDGDGIAPAGRASANAANFPLLGGLIRPEEIAQGRIDHALVFGQPGIGAGRPVCPATANVSTTSDPLALREGTLLQLDPAVDVDALPLPGWQKVVARALQKYGMYLRDNSGSLAIYAENSIARGYDAWEKVGLPGGSIGFSSAFPWTAMRVIHAPDC